MTEKEAKNSYRVYETSAIGRLQPGDVKLAVEDYQQDNEHLPTLLVLHPRHEKLAAEVPEGVEVLFLENLMSWEIWMADGRVVPDFKKEDFIPEVFSPAAPSAEPPQTPPEPKIAAGGMKRLPFLGLEPVTERIMALAVKTDGQGRPLSCRAIQKKLKDEGIEVSHMTVFRRLNEKEEH